MTVVFFTILLENGFLGHKAPENPQNKSHQNRTEGSEKGKSYRIAKGGVVSKEVDGIDDGGCCKERNGCVSWNLLLQKAVDDGDNPAFTRGKNKADKGSKKNPKNLVLRKKGMDPIRGDIDIDEARNNRANQDKGQGLNDDGQKDSSHLQDRSRKLLKKVCHLSSLLQSHWLVET